MVGPGRSLLQAKQYYLPNSISNYIVLAYGR